MANKCEELTKFNDHCVPANHIATKKNEMINTELLLTKPIVIEEVTEDFFDIEEMTTTPGSTCAIRIMPQPGEHLRLQQCPAEGPRQLILK